MPEPTWKVSSQQDFSKLRAAALDRSTKKQNNRVGLEEDIARNDNESGADQPSPLREGLDTDTAYPLLSSNSHLFICPQQHILQPLVIVWTCCLRIAGGRRVLKWMTLTFHTPPCWIRRLAFRGPTLKLSCTVL